MKWTSNRELLVDYRNVAEKNSQKTQRIYKNAVIEMSLIIPLYSEGGRYVSSSGVHKPVDLFKT